MLKRRYIVTPYTQYYLMFQNKGEYNHPTENIPETQKLVLFFYKFELVWLEVSSGVAVLRTGDRMVTCVWSNGREQWGVGGSNGAMETGCR